MNEFAFLSVLHVQVSLVIHGAVHHFNYSWDLSEIRFENENIISWSDQFLTYNTGLGQGVICGFHVATDMEFSSAA